MSLTYVTATIDSTAGVTGTTYARAGLPREPSPPEAMMLGNEPEEGQWTTMTPAK